MQYDPQIDQQLDSHFPKINWMGQQWYVKTTSGNVVGPGPNIFDASSVQVDHKGALNLSIRNNGSQWLCAEVMSKNLFTFGNFEWVLQGDVYNLDPNVVFTMFLYPAQYQAGSEGTNQIDLEFSRWGNLRAQNLDYTIFPPAAYGQRQNPISKNVMFNHQNSVFSSHQVVWAPTSIQMQSSHLYPNGPPKVVSSLPMTVQQSKIPQIPLRCHMSLWLYRGSAPTNGQNVNIPIRGFKYNPL